MKRKAAVKLVSAGLVLCLGMGLFAGCKERTVDYDIDGVTENSESIPRTDGDGGMGLKQFADVSSWEEGEWTAVASDGEKYQCIVDVDVSVPQAEQMYVVEVEESSFDEAYQERIAGNIFGTGEIYYNDIAHLTRQGLSERSVSYQKTAYILSEELRTLRETRILQCEEAMETAKDVYAPAETYDVNEYLGKRDRISYELSFGEGDTAAELYLRYMGNILLQEESRDFLECRGKHIFLMPKDIYQVCPEEVSDVEDLYYVAENSVETVGISPTNENQCKISREEAQELAQSFVESLGLDYSVYAGSSPLWWFNGFVNSNVTYFEDGYVFFYDAGVDDISFVQYGTQGNYQELKQREVDERQYSLRSRMEVYVNGNGIIGMKAYNPIEIRNVSGGVKLLSLDAIKEIIKENGGRNKLLDLNEWNDFTGINELRLIYFRVRDKENPGYYSYVPTWRLSYESKLDENMNPACIMRVMLVNAIDGSVIELDDEV